MLCECCQKNDATIHVTQLVNNQSRELHLCEGCAEESGMNVQNVMSIPEILFGLGASETKEEGQQSTSSCPHCHLRGCDFKKTARLGCPHCYEAFAKELGPMLAAMHKGIKHIGKIPEYLRQSLEKSALCEDLQRKLEGAIRDEKYEEAAFLRDRIREAGNAAG
ncbi:MAG: UvrB/UvrC motif-containing protein [bacterium]|jgi:protein arginine kinase activator